MEPEHVETKRSIMKLGCLCSGLQGPQRLTLASHEFKQNVEPEHMQRGTSPAQNQLRV